MLPLRTGAAARGARRVGLACVRSLPGSARAWGAQHRPLATRAELEARRRTADVPFEAHAAELLQRLLTGLQSMVETNSGAMVVERGEGGLVIRVGDKAFTLTVDASSKAVAYASPKAGHTGGPLQYKHDARTGQWTNTTDGHLLLELLSRDLIYHAKGYPNF